MPLKKSSPSFTKDKLALRYNDRSVLENHHIAVAFDTMLRDPDTCIYDEWTDDEFRLMRTNMIDLVLATDMANHFKDLSTITSRLEQKDWNVKTGFDKKIAMNLLIHMADISNPTKPWKICVKWIDLLFIEFFNQGDLEREKGLPVSYLMDRTTTNIARA